MAIIVEIKKKPRLKNVYIITLDSGEFYSVYDEYIITHKLKVDKEISITEMEKIQAESDNKIAMQYCGEILSHGLKTCHELKTKLLQKGINEQSVKNALEKMKEYNYINDEKYANIYVQQFKSAKGKIKIKNELMLKGVNQNIINEALNQFEEDEEISSAQHSAEKYLKNKELNYKNKQKLYAHLISKGYGFDVINKVLNLYTWEFSSYDNN